MMRRKLGRSGLEISAVGLGCWAIGGPFDRDGRSVGWGQVDDAESIRAIHRALDLGITFFDTAALYGCGHSERVLGQALGGQRDRVIVATKFGARFDETARQMFEDDPQPEDVRPACEDSLRRLNTEYIDLFQLHSGDTSADTACAIRDEMENLVKEGKIRFYGWSTNLPERARAFAEGRHCISLQFSLNVFNDDAPMVGLCEELGLAAIANGPLDKGLLTGKYDRSAVFPSDDIRSRLWDLKEGRQAERLAALAKIRHVLTRDGRSLAQAALGWILARSEVTVPIPGFKTVHQVEEHAAAASFGPLHPEQMEEIQALLTQD